MCWYCIDASMSLIYVLPALQKRKVLPLPNSNTCILATRIIRVSLPRKRYPSPPDEPSWARPVVAEVLSMCLWVDRVSLVALSLRAKVSVETTRLLNGIENANVSCICVLCGHAACQGLVRIKTRNRTARRCSRKCPTKDSPRSGYMICLRNFCSSPSNALAR